MQPLNTLDHVGGMSASAIPSATAPSPHKPSPTANTKPNRLPAPLLFVGPPSRNASSLSVSRQTGDANSLKPSRDPLIGHRSTLSRTLLHENGRPTSLTEAGKDKPTPLTKPDDNTIDTKWKEMQATLNEVELTAQSSTHVFGASHGAALDDLRRAQIELARAWARGNEDKDSDLDPQDTDINIQRFRGAEDLAVDSSFKGGRPRGSTMDSASTALSDESVSTTEGPAGDGGMHGGRRGNGTQQEDETAQDIRLASERRAANEAYFRKVDGSVKDVVAKLQVVAEAMREAEGESRSLWSGSESGRSAEGSVGKTGNAAPG